jgi:hypothetical protein
VNGASGVPGSRRIEPMFTDDRPPRGGHRDTNPLWIAAGILGLVYLGYQYVSATMPPPPPPAAQATAGGPPSMPAAESAAAQRMRDESVAAQARQAQARAMQSARNVPPPYDGPAQAPLPSSREIYLCKGYSGNMFWSDTVCSAQRATIDRIVSVPTNVSWQEQVAIAEGNRREAQQWYAPPPAPAQQPSQIGRAAVASDTGGECALLDEHIKRLDAMARQPQSGATQDWIRTERQAARSRQAHLRC